MENNNCINCMYSEYSELNILINDITGGEYTTCIHKNSPYYMERVNYDHLCRFYIDSVKYFKNKDRKDKLDNLENNKKINEE